MQKHWDGYRLAVDCVISMADKSVLTEILIHSDDADLYVLSGYKVFFVLETKSAVVVFFFS